MAIVYVNDLYKEQAKYADKQVTVAGWVRSIRNSKKLSFVVINDGTAFNNLQVIVEDRLPNYEFVAKQNVGAALRITGCLVLTPQAKQPFEIQAEEVVIEGESTPDYPLQKKRHGFEFLRTMEHLRPRTNTFAAVFRVRSLLAFAVHDFFRQHQFVYVHTPIITSNDCEGAGEMFRVTTLPTMSDSSRTTGPGNQPLTSADDFFGRETHLTVSGQLNVEPFAMAFRNVYTFGPTFRAENSNTARHAAEFWMIEPEMAFADLADDMDLAEAMVKHLINYVLKEAPDEMAFFNQFVDKGLLERLYNVVNHQFVRISYTEAVDILQKNNHQFDYPVSWGNDLQTEHERYLTEVVYQRPVFVTDYPKDIKAFYMKLNDDGKTVAATDLLVPGVGEIIGGSQREDDFQKLEQRMKAMGMNPEEYDWYLDLRRYGTAYHAGFGLGFDRMVMYVTGMSNIRDVLAYPRTVGNCHM